MQKIHIQEPYKTLLINWIKKVEWRLNKWKFKDAKIWDIFKLNDSEYLFKLVNKINYKSFYDMLKTEWISKVLPNITNIEDWLKVYYSFYTKEQEELYWVLALYFEKVDNNN